MDDQSAHRQHLISVAFVPFQAWRTLALHYHALGKSVHWDATDRFEAHYRRAATSDPPEPLLYTESQPVGGPPPCDSICVREWCPRKNAEPKQLPLVVFATHAMLALRALLADAFAPSSKRVSPRKWPVFLRLLVFRITVQQHSRPWWSNCKEGTEDYAVAALHQLIARLLYNHETASTEWTQGASPSWLQYHAEYEHAQKALTVLMKSKNHWQRRPVQLARAPLELCSSTNVQVANGDVQVYVHPYQLSLAIYAVLSQAVHLIYVAQHESCSYGVYYASRTATQACTMCHSQWHMGKASVGQAARALYERLVMMLRSSSASTSNANSLVSSSSGMSSDQTLYVCNSTCHWCMLLRTMCLAVMRQLQVRKLVRQHQGASMLPADDNYVCATVALQVQLHQYDETGVNGNSQHQQCTWRALPIEPMLQQALHCFRDASLLLQQFHTLAWYKTSTAVTPSLPLRLRLWRVRNRVARVVPMCYGGAAQTLALYKALESLWWIGAWVILPRVLCAVERYVREFLTLQQASAIVECVHEPHHYIRGQDDIESHEQFAHTVSYCISLACRYYDAHSRVGWSDAPMRVNSTTSDQYAHSQPLLAVYATLEALLTCITRPAGEEHWVSSMPLMSNTCASTSSAAPFLGPAVRHYTQCQAMKDLKTVYSVENNTTHYQQQSLLQWWVVPYNAEFAHSVDEDEHQCTLGDLQYTCRIATSACAKRIGGGDQHTSLLSGGVSNMIDRVEADSSVQLNTCNSLASMMVAYTHSAEMIWNAFSSEEECKNQMDIGIHRPTLCSEFLAAVPTRPPSSLHYAVMCGTSESLLLLRELNNTRTNTIQCARDICTMPDVRECTPVPEYLHFLHDLLLGDDKQLARAAQWLYTRLFYEPRARDQSIEREGDLAALCLQEGDAALRFVRLLPMMLESVIAPNPEQSAESVFTALVVPYREAGALRQEYKQRRRKQPAPTPEDVDLCWTEESSQSSADDVNDLQPAGDEEHRRAAHNKHDDDAKDFRVMNLSQCSLHSNLLALLSPYHMRIGISYHTLQQVWCALLDNRELWVAHHQLTCIMVEWLSLPRATMRMQSASVCDGIPTWYAWRVMRAAYVRWRIEEQKRKCPSPHDGRLCYREQKLTGIPDSARWVDRHEITNPHNADAPSATKQRRLTSQLKRSPATTSWCLCRQCAQVSCTQPVPQWVYRQFSSSSEMQVEEPHRLPTPGFWHINMALRYEPDLLRMVHEHAYVPVQDYAAGPARNTGVYCNIDGPNTGSSGDNMECAPRRSIPTPLEPLTVYDPLCPVPPYPDSPEDVQQWKEYTFQPSSRRAKCVWDTDIAHVPSCSQLMPDIQPPHLLFYAFACDPSVSSELRAEIFRSVRAWRGFQRYEMRPARPSTNTLVSSPVDAFCTGAEQAHEWCQEQARQFCKTSSESEFQEHHKTALNANEVDHYNDNLRWMGSGLQPLTFEQLLHNKLMPLRTVTHLALFSDILARLPFHKSETPEVVQQLIEQCLQNNNTSYRIPRNASRATLMHEALSALYDPSIIHAALLNLRYKGQSLPLLWHTSPYNNNTNTQLPIPSEAVLRDMRDWINPKVSYSHDTMPVYDLPMSMQYDPKITLGSCSVQYKDPIDRIGPFGLCMPEALHTAVTNPITHVHGDLVSLDRLENSLGRNSGIVRRELDVHSIDALSSGIDFSSCKNGHPHLASPARSPRMGHVPVPLLMHGPLVTNTISLPDTERAPQYDRIVNIKWYTPGEIGQRVYTEQRLNISRSSTAI